MSIHSVNLELDYGSLTAIAHLLHQIRVDAGLPVKEILTGAPGQDGELAVTEYAASLLLQAIAVAEEFRRRGAPAVVSEGTR